MYLWTIKGVNQKSCITIIFRNVYDSSVCVVAIKKSPRTKSVYSYSFLVHLVYE